MYYKVQITCDHETILSILETVNKSRTVSWRDLGQSLYQGINMFPFSFIENPTINLSIDKYE
jgi:hypothetical protein